MNPIDFNTDRDQQLLHLLENEHYNAKPLIDILLCEESQLVDRLVLVDRIKNGMLECTVT